MVAGACPHQLELMQKRAQRDALDVQIHVCKASDGLFKSILKLHWSLFQTMMLLKNYLKAYDLRACQGCDHQEVCLRRFYEMAAAMRQPLLEGLPKFEAYPRHLRIPFFYGWILRRLQDLLDDLDDRVEDLYLASDPEINALLHDIADACRDASPKLKDWRESMSFLQ